MPRETDNDCLALMPRTVAGDPWAAANLPECRAVRLRVRFEAFGAACQCAAHGAASERACWFFVSKSAASDELSLRTLPMDPAERMVLREHDSGSATFGDGCVVHVLALELAPLPDKSEAVYMARDYESEQRERMAARRDALERECVLAARCMAN
jgi:hypothetical protein